MYILQKNMKKFYIVPHSHLDREWYRTFQENRIKLVRFLDDLIETMEQDQDYSIYYLDAQTSFIDDYFDVKPHMKERFTKLVQEGRLPIGPWYVQPDEHLPTAEGIIRNLLISKNISDNFADHGKICYVPDSFGQSASFPTLMKGFGIDSAIMYRGFAEEDSKYNDFVWQGYDGSELIANWMPVGYGNAMFLQEDNDEKNMQEIQTNIELLEKRSVSENYLLMCGSDQSFVKKFLPQTIKRLNELYKDKNYEFVLASPQEYVDQIKLHTDKMETIVGELRKGKRSRTHNSIGATRMDIKQMNHQVEMKYLKVLEPLSTMMNLFGYENDRELINRGWKYIVENHAHDSICCCCTDAIHDEIMMRMIYADQLANYLIKEKFDALNNRINYNLSLGRPIVLFSTYLGKREDYVEVDVYVKDENFIIQDVSGNNIPYECVSKEMFNLKDTKVSFTPIPDDIYTKMKIRAKIEMEGLGYKTVYLKEGITQIKEVKEYAKGNTLENDLIHLTVEKNGTWTIQDKISGVKYSNQHIFVDDGNAGDEYDYSPSFNDEQFTTLNRLESIEVLENTTMQGSLKLVYKLNTPITTSNECRSKVTMDTVIDVIVSVKEGKKQIDVKTTITNEAENHRIQVYFDGNKLFKTNIADVQLGEIVRENEFELTVNSEKDGWHERYYPVFNQHKYSGLVEDGKGFIILNRGLPQYEIFQNETTNLAITLLSCVGYMGNTDLKYRPGRRSGSTDATPNSQMKGTYTFEYSFMPVEKSDDYIQEAEKYINELKAVSFAEFSSEGDLADNMTIAKSDSGCFLSVYKQCEKDNDHILRIVNPYLDEVNDLELVINRYLYQNKTCCDLAEKPIVNKLVKEIKYNNPDGSAKAEKSGILQIKSIKRNQLLTFKLEK